MADVSAPWLPGKRVLVTRPVAQAGGLVKSIEAQGGCAISCPVLTIEALAETAAEKQKIIDLDHYDALIVVSPNAARLGLPQIDNYWPQLPAHLRWFAVGKATASCLEREGIRPLLPAQGFNSEALLAMPELSGEPSSSSMRVLILKGEGGRELLEQQLTQRGMQVDTLALYRRTAQSYSPEQLKALFAEGDPDALVATSVDILRAMDSLLATTLMDRLELPLVVASQRIAEAARQLGYHRIVTASGAADESIVTALNVIG